MNDDFLNTLQSDIVEILKATPTLAAVNVIPEDDGDMNAKIANLLGTLKNMQGTLGIMAVVMLPEVADAEPNLPGPPMKVLCQIQVIEQTLMNRGKGGSCVRTSAAALYILQALQHHGLATHSLYARPSRPIEPVAVKKGFLSHMVSVEAKFRGLQSPGRPGAVTGQMVDADLVLTGGGAEADIYFTTDGSYPTPHTGTLYEDPIEDLPGGTVVRAAAYAEGLLPGPLTEIEITD